MILPLPFCFNLCRGSGSQLTYGIRTHHYSEITKDDEYTLCNVTVFKKVKDEYLHKCREHK